MLRIVVGALLAAVAVCANAQAYGPPISLEQARKVLATAEAETRKNNLNMGIAVVDAGGHLVLFQRMDGAQFVSENVHATRRGRRWPTSVRPRPSRRGSPISV